MQRNNFTVSFCLELDESIQSELIARMKTFLEKLENLYLDNKMSDAWKLIKHEAGGFQQHKLELRVGNWHCVFYIDLDYVFEVNCSLYSINQRFLVGSKEYTAYELMDIFIIGLAKKIN